MAVDIFRYLGINFLFRRLIHFVRERNTLLPILGFLCLLTLSMSPEVHADSLVTVKENKATLPLEQQYQDEDGNPVTGPDGYAVVRKEYENRRKLILKSYYDLNDKPVAIS